MTVDEILASGRYTDRRGRRWTRSNYGIWMHPVAFHPVLGVRSETRQLNEMRLLIERDMHRCSTALQYCANHPVPVVWKSRPFKDFAAKSKHGGGWFSTHSEAMDAAYRLAVANE